ncbi:MAG: response regulator [Kofleriaceae bacterium]
MLAADDDRTSRDQLASLLRADGHAVELCEDGQEALGRVALGGIDLVILDVMMPRLNGTETCRLLKSLAGVSFLPVILVTARNDPASRVEGLRIGADDYVGKPFDPEELSARVNAMLRIRRIIGGLAEDRDRLLRRAAHDELTGLPNRRSFEARLTEERKRAERYHEPFACLLTGVTAGNPTRDIITGGAVERLVTRASSAVKRSVREGDVVARIADTTFAVILTHTHFAGAIAAAERIFRDVTTSLCDSNARVAIGVALFPSRDGRTPEMLLSAAESALEEAWLRGGDQICVLQQRKYLYTPGTAPRSERPPASTRLAPNPSDPPPPASVRRGPSEPPPSYTDPLARDPGDRRT